MRIAITGAASTGKTTLAKKISQEMGLPFVGNAARRVSREIGLGPKNIDNYDDLFWFQEAVLRDMMTLHKQPAYVTDRSVSDVYAYTLLGLVRLWDESGTAPTQAHLGRLAEIRIDCKSLAPVYNLILRTPLETPFMDDGFRFAPKQLDREREDRTLIWACRDLNIFPELVKGSVVERMRCVTNLVERFHPERKAVRA